MIRTIRTRIRRTNNGGVFHDSKKDVATLTTVCRELIEKVNELTEEVNRLTSKEE